MSNTDISNTSNPLSIGLQRLLNVGLYDEIAKHLGPKVVSTPLGRDRAKLNTVLEIQLFMLASSSRYYRSLITRRYSQSARRLLRKYFDDLP